MGGMRQKPSGWPVRARHPAPTNPYPAAIALHVHVFGPENGEPLVCLHGLSAHGARFRRLAGLLPGRRLIAPDLRGHGRSTYAPPWTTEVHVADALAAAPEGCHDWLGYSYGGRIAAAVAAAAPDRVRRLILLDPALSLPPDVAEDGAHAALAPESYADAEAVVRAHLDGGTLHSTPREVLEEEVTDHYAPRPDGRLEARFCRPMMVTAWSEMARAAPPRAEVPTLLVTGARSWIAVDAATLIPTCHVEVPGGHSVLWDDLERTAEAIAGFLH